LLSARTSLRLPGYLPSALAYLPVAQTMWYVPTGLDPWNQLLGKAPGHYGGRGQRRDASAPIAAPERHWPDQDPVTLDGSFDERLNRWLMLVQRGEVPAAYRVFLGLFQEGEPARPPRPPGVRRAHRRAGPHALQPLVHDGPRVVPCAPGELALPGGGSRQTEVVDGTLAFPARA
jgi:hypothetical protein